MADQTQQDVVIGVVEQAINNQLARVTFGGDPGRYVEAIAWNAGREAARELARRGLVNSLGPGQHAMVTVDPERNHGRASITRRMVPIWSPAGLLRAGDPVEVIREEFDLTEAEAAVIAALSDDFQDLAAGDDYDDEEPAPPEVDACRTEIVDVDGRQEVVRVRGAEPMDDLDREMFAELVAATRAYAAQDEHMGVRQELASAWMAVARRMPEGPEKGRLRAAVTAAQEVLRARRNNGDGDANVDIP